MMIRNRSILLAFVSLFLIQVVFSQEELMLSSALSRALENNYGLIISRAETEIASINNDWGNAGRYPTIGFDNSAFNNFYIPDKTDQLFSSQSIGMNWILFDGFRVNNTKSKLENLETLSEGLLGVMIESSIEDVILGYYNVLLQQEQLEVLKTVMELSDDRHQYELERQSLGGSVTYNVLQAQNVYLTDKANFMNQEVLVRNAVRNLNFMMGEQPVKTWGFNEPFESDTTEYILADLLHKMKSGNQALKNQYTNLLLQENETSLKWSAYWPTLSLGTGINHNQSWNVYPSQSTTNHWNFNGGLSLSYDIYSTGVRKRSVEVARINEEVARVETTEIEHALTNELFNLFDYHGVRIELLNVAGENLEAAELNLSISEEKYRSGVINSFNYRDVQLIYLNASVRHLRAIYNLINSKTQLTRITGGFLGQDNQK